MTCLSRTLLLLTLVFGTAACDSSTAAADGGDANDALDAAIRCGVTGTAACPSATPVCSQYADHNTGAVAGARCEALPTECAADPSCTCLTQAYSTYPDGGRRCPGPVYCSDTDAGVTVRCVPP